MKDNKYGVPISHENDERRSLVQPKFTNRFRVFFIDIGTSNEVATGRTVSHYSLYDCDGFVNTLPLGLEFDVKNGRIFGTLHNINNVGTYTFTIMVYDSVMLSSCQIMNLVITE